MNEMHELVYCERLYLSKEEKNEIYVNNVELLKQHQIDGLRFLFKQFKKKIPGVVVNFPSACGKSVTVALFINAIQHTLKLPILILCNNNNEVVEWKERFAKWTDFKEDDIAVEASNPLIKKKVFIKKCPVELNSYLRRSWSIVIVKEDYLNKEILNLVFTADYKIWITSTDLRKDLSFLSFVYTWLDPKLKMNIDEFKANSPAEKYQKAVFLETFIEDVVIQRKFNLEPFTSKEENLNVEKVAKTLKRSIKNKDATGTKIKRSKKRIDEEKVSVTPTEIPIIDPGPSISTKNNNDQENDFTISNHERNKSEVMQDKEESEANNRHNSPKLDVESFIRDQQPLEATNVSNIEQDFTPSFDFSTAVNEIVFNELKGNSTESLHSDIEIKIDNKDVVILEGDKNSLVNESLKNLQENEVDIVEKNLTYVHENETKTTKVELNENHVNGKGVNNEDNKGDTTKILETINNKVSNEMETNTTDIKTQMADIIDNNETEKSDGAKKGIDDKISELEEKTLKKFKGSLLDSIF